MKFFALFLFLISSQSFASDDFKEMLERYLAFNKERAEFLVSHKEKIIGVEIIIADEANNLASRFGHALIRFVDNDGHWANDAVVSFGALSEEETYSLWKGVFGGYPILPQVMNLHEYWTQYTKTEKRDLKRYVLNLSPTDLDKFLTITFDYIKHPEKLKNYTFARNNCVGVISKFLIEAGLTVNDRQAIVPSNVHKWLKKNKLTVFPEFTMKNPAKLEAKLAQQNVNLISSAELIESFTEQELSYIYLNKTDLSYSHFLFLSKYLVKSNADVDDAFSFTDISLDLYNRCDTLDCFRKFDSAEKTMKVQDQLDVITYRLNENSDLQRLYLDHRNFSKKELVRLVDLKVRNHTFTLKKKNNKIFFQAWGTPRNAENSTNQRIDIALQFTIKNDKVLLLDEEIGSLTKDGLKLHANYRLLLHASGKEEVLSLIKI